ncbi:MAG: endo-1,4-beta-xylanase [Pirellulales bacterium]|nr:endo-1,4-beta-xylanase [Pirellulales bacterium]
MTYRTLLTLQSCCVLVLALPASAEVPESYRKAWSNASERIDANIERYRKGDATIEVVGDDGQPVPGASLAIEQKTHEFLFGCNAFVLGQMGDKNGKYEETFARLFNFATVPFYWEGTEPVQGQLRYEEGSPDRWRRPPADRYLPFARKHGITLKGHPLLWHAYNPPWLPKDAEELKKLYQKRFAEIAARYAREIPIWDVVNESLVCAKDYPLNSPDRAYVAWAFREVVKVFRPDNLLMINEVTSFHRGAGEENAYFRQVRQLINDGVDVRGIGFQFHFFSFEALEKYLSDPSYAPQKLLDTYESFAALDRPLFVTEITIPTPPEDGEAVQAEAVGNLYRLWFSAPRMAGITWWNLGDGTAVKGENKAMGGLVDDQLDPKESYRTLDKLINQDWKTKLSMKTDASGKARFRGFLGKYTVRATAGGREQEFEIEVFRGGDDRHKIVVRGR